MESKDKKWAIISIAAIFAVPAGIGFWHYCDTQAQTAKISAEIAFEKFKEEKRAEILDWAFYIAIIVMFIGFVVFTFMDAF